jgi:DNA-binding MarR family transcriptional regulator
MMERNVEAHSLVLAEHLEILVKACDRSCAAFPSLVSMTKMERAALNILGESGGITVSQLSESLRAPMSSTSVLIDGLESAGQVQRTRGIEDRRSVVVQLTKSGMSAYQDILQSRLDFARELLAPMIPEEQVQFLALIQVAREAIEANELNQKPATLV